MITRKIIEENLKKAIIKAKEKHWSRYTQARTVGITVDRLDRIVKKYNL